MALLRGNPKPPPPSRAERWDVVVVGGGAAGLAAAIFTAQAGLTTLVVDAGKSTMRETRHIRNYLGFPSYVGGEELLEKGREHLARLDATVRDAKVAKLARNESGGFRVALADGSALDARYLVLATGFAAGLSESLGIERVKGLGGYFPDWHVKTDDACRAAPGVYAAGLARRWEYQALITAGDGARAAVTLLSDHFGKPYVGHDD